MEYLSYHLVFLQPAEKKKGLPEINYFDDNVIKWMQDAGWECKIGSDKECSTCTAAGASETIQYHSQELFMWIIDT